MSNQRTVDNSAQRLAALKQCTTLDQFVPLRASLTGGEIEGNVRIESEASGGLTMVGGNLTLNKGTSESGSLYGGEINAAGAIYGQYLQATSDIRLKDNVEFLAPGDGLKMALAITPCTFTWKDNGKESVGVIAQEVQDVVPQAVKEAPNGYLTVGYGELTAVCLAAIRDLANEVREIKECLKKC